MRDMPLRSHVASGLLSTQILKLFAFCTVFLLLVAVTYPALAGARDNELYDPGPAEVTAFDISSLHYVAESIALMNQRDRGIDVDPFIDTSTQYIDLNRTDYGPDIDGDGIPDSVELGIRDGCQ